MNYLLPRLEHIFFVAIFVGIVMGGYRMLNFDGDLPRHLLMGNLIIRERSVPTVDIFSFRTTNLPSIPHEWLSQVILAGIYDWLGLNGIVLLVALIMMLVWMVVFQETQTRSRNLFFSLLFVVLAASASQIHVLPRPHIFTYLLTAIWITILERIATNSSSKWWILPIIMIVWVNLHGMFVLGIILWGIYLVGDFLDSPSRVWFTETRTNFLILGGLFSLIATFFSPSGVSIWKTIYELGSNSYITSRITEYQSANFHLPETWPFLTLLLASIVGFARTRKTRWTHLLLAIAFTVLAIYSSRMIPLFAIVLAPVTSKAFADWARDEHPTSFFLTFEQRIAKVNSTANGWIWIVLVIFGIFTLLQRGISLNPNGLDNMFDGHFFPVNAVDWLESNPQEGRMFNEFDWGGYILFRLWPDYQIFMDGHTHIYGEVLTREYDQVIHLGPGWEAILDKYDIQWVFLRATNPVVNALSGQSWLVSYRDNTAIILTRSTK